MGATLASKRRSEPDLAIEDDTSSQESQQEEREYVTTSLITPAVANISQIDVHIMTSVSVTSCNETAVSVNSSHTNQVQIIDPKEILRRRHDALLPSSFYEPLVI